MPICLIMIDIKDRRILLELDLNARQSNSQIGKKVGLSKEVVKYRIDKLKERGIILRHHAIINYFKLGISKFKLYLRLTNIDKEKQSEIAQYFYKHPRTEWVAITTGRWDMIIGFLVHNINEFDDEVLIVLNRFSKYIQEKSVTTTLYLAHQAREFLKGGDKYPDINKVTYHTSKDKQEKINQLEDEILMIIANNARIPLIEIAKKINTTPRIIQYHLRELERRRIILAYKAHLNPKAMEKIFCKAIIYLINLTQDKLNKFVSYASSLPGTIWPQRVMGSWDFELDLELDGYDAFQDVILDLKERFPDIIKSHEFCIVSKEFKLDLYPGCYPAMGL